MADGELRLGGKLLKDLRVKDLKEELETRGLPKTGSKTQLLARLKSVITVLFFLIYIIQQTQN